MTSPWVNLLRVQRVSPQSEQQFPICIATWGKSQCCLCFTELLSRDFLLVRRISGKLCLLRWWPKWAENLWDLHSETWSILTNSHNVIVFVSRWLKGLTELGNSLHCPCSSQHLSLSLSLDIDLCSSRFTWDFPGHLAVNTTETNLRVLCTHLLMV